MKMPEERLIISIILQAIKDYHDNIGDNRFIVRTWVETMAGSFKLCAEGWGKTPEVLRELMLKKMDAIDNGEVLKFK